MMPARLAFLLLLALVACASHAQISHVATTSASSCGKATAPAFQAQGAAASGTGAVSVAWPTHIADDIGLLFIETAGGAVATPAGWTIVTNSPQTTGTETRLSVFWRRATSAAMGNATAVDPGDHYYGRIITYRGAITSGDPWDITGGGVKDAATTSVTVTGVTTTVCNTTVVQAVSRDNDNAGAAFSAQTNANLSGITERSDAGTTSGNGGGIGVWDGLKAAPGATGDTTATVTSSRNAFLTIALQAPDATTLAVNVPGGTASGHTMLATISVRPSSATITAPAGWTLVRETTQANDVTMRMATYRRLAGGSEPASYTWTFSGAHSGATGTISTFSGVDTGSPVDIDGGTASGVSGFTFTATGVTTTVTNTMVVTSHAFTTASTWTPPGSMTEAAEVASLTANDAAGLSMETNYVLQAAAGATGDKTATADSTAPADVGFGISHIVALRPGYTHYSVSYGAANYATCEPALVRIEAHNGAHVLTAPPAGTILTINTSTTDGVWQSPLVTGTPANWSALGANDGVATYTWNGTENVIEARLRRNIVGALSLNLTDNHPVPKSEGVGEDLSVTYADTVLRITADGATTATINSGFTSHIAGKYNNEGANVQALYVQAVASAPASGACTTLFQNQTRNVEFAAVCNSPATCYSAAVNTAPLFEIRSGDGTGAAVNIEKNNNTGSPSAYSTVSLNFSNDANAMAPLVFRYGDAGRMTLHMRYTLPSPPATTIAGSSNAFVVRPFAIAIRGADASTAISHGTDETSAVLAAAGDNFTMTLVAYKWAAGQDVAPLDGVPDFAVGDTRDITANGVTPNFAPAAWSFTPALNLPGIATGALTRGANCASSGDVLPGDWSGGAATITDWCYSEAGNVFLTGFAFDYIDAGVLVFANGRYDGSAYANGRIGRFKPKHFAVSAGALTNRSAASCAPASSFSYMDERLNLGFTLTAQNRQGATTQNYTGSYAKLNVGSTASFVLGARSGTTNLTTRLDTSGTPTGSWSNGVANMTVPTSVRRATPDSPDGPYTAISFGIAPVDSDSVAMKLPLDLDVNNDATMDRASLGVSGEARYGRLRVLNAIGSEKLALPLPIRTEYWSGTGFVTNTADSCTAIGRDAIDMSFTPASNLSDTNCETAISTASVAFTSGVGSLTLLAPGAGNNGSVLLTPQLRTPGSGNYCPSVGGAPTAIGAVPSLTYLLGRWNDAANPDSDANTSYDDNPSGRAAFGVYGNQPSNYIYFRENH